MLCILTSSLLNAGLADCRHGGACSTLLTGGVSSRLAPSSKAYQHDSAQCHPEPCVQPPLSSPCTRLPSSCYEWWVYEAGSRLAKQSRSRLQRLQLECSFVRRGMPCLACPCQRCEVLGPLPTLSVVNSTLSFHTSASLSLAATSTPDVG